MTRDERIRERLFPNATPFKPSRGGYAALPFVLRRVQWMFDARGWQIYTYVLMRIGQHGVGWLTLQEMSWDLGFRSIPKLKAYVSKLVEDGWLLHSSSRAREYFMAPDPTKLLEKLAAEGKLPPERLEAIDEILESLKWETIQKPPVKQEADSLDAGAP
jgi:hypothetical protein